LLGFKSGIRTLSKPFHLEQKSRFPQLQVSNKRSTPIT